MVTPPFTIRKARSEDLQTLVQHNADMAWETEGKNLDRGRLAKGVAAVLGDPGKGTYWVCESEGRVVGQLLVTYEWSDWRAGVFWWIQSVYVPPEWRRRGVFRALFRHLEKMARQDPNVCGLRLYVERSNARAKATYQALGMEETGYDIYEMDFVLGDGKGKQHSSCQADGR